MADEFDELLNLDALALAEKLTGLSYKDDHDTELLGLALHIQQVQRKKDELALRDDTYHSMPIHDMYRILTDLGFYVVHSHTFPSMSRDVDEETFTLWWHDDGVLAQVETYRGNTVNSSKIYYNWKHKRDLENRFSYTSSGKFDMESYDAGGPDVVWVGDHDAREALKHNLARLRSAGEFLPVWIDRPWLWFVDYSQAHRHQNDPVYVSGHRTYYDEINKKIISELPDHVRAAISPRGVQD